MMKEISIINGPNLNLLGSKNKHLYGDFTLTELNKKIEAFAKEHNTRVHTHQFNAEGQVIDAIHDASDMTGIVINPAAYTHYSYGIRSAIEAVSTPVVEVHLSNIHQGEPFRKISVIAPACVGQINGLGWHGYILAIKYLVEK